MRDPNGQHFQAAPRLVWAVADSAALVGGHDAGPPGPLPHQDRLGDFWLPQRGIFAVGTARFDPYDPTRHHPRHASGNHLRGDDMSNKAVISLTTGLEDPEKVTVAFLVAVGAAEQGRPTLMFLTKEAARLALDGVATAVACEGCPPLVDLVDRYAKAGGRYLICPICFDARKLDKGQLIETAELGGTVPMWRWIGDDGATTFSY